MTHPLQDQCWVTISIFQPVFLAFPSQELGCNRFLLVQEDPPQGYGDSGFLAFGGSLSSWGRSLPLCCHPGLEL